MKSSVWAIGVVLLLPGAVASAQSLGTVAAEEAARRKAIAQPARVLENDDLRVDYPVTTPTDLPAWPDDAVDDPSPRRVLVEPAALQGGPLPGIPVLAVAGGEVFLEVTVDRQGEVEAVKALRDTPPFTGELAAAVAGWRFAPAEDVAAPLPGRPVDERTRRSTVSKVLVVGLFRPPALFARTLGTPPVDAGTPSTDAPALLGAAAMPLYPPNSLFDGMVLVELRLGVDGAVMRRRLVRSSAGFDGPTLTAVDALSFRPARIAGAAVPSVVYVLAAFRQPVTP